MVNEMRRPELYGRLAPSLIIFDLIRPEVVPSLCSVLLGRLGASASAQLGMTMRFDTDGLSDLVMTELAKGGYKYGGRAVPCLSG